MRGFAERVVRLGVLRRQRSCGRLPAAAASVFGQVQWILVSYRPLDLCRARRMKARDVISLSLTRRLLTIC